MGRVALDTIPSPHTYRSLRRLQARRARESQLLSLQLELGQVKFERDILANRDKEWWSWWNECQQLQQQQQQQQQLHMQMEEVEEEEEADFGDIEDQGEDEAVQKNPSQVLPHDDLPQQLKEMQVRELAFTQAMHELGQATEQLETCLQEALLNNEEQDNRWKAKWDKREKMMLQSFEEQFEDQRFALIAEAKETIQKMIEMFDQQCEQMVEKQSHRYEDMLDELERRKHEQIDELQSRVADLTQGTPKNKPKRKKNKGTPG